MGLYMIRSHFKPEDRDAVIKRYAANPNATEGITQHGDWIPVVGDGGYHLMEADDPKLIMDELLKYTDLCSYTVEPVVPADEFLGLVAKHGLGS